MFLDGIDESYTMTVGEVMTTIHAKTIWGAMWALQTLSQLVVYNGNGYSIPSIPIEVIDAPRFPWRGLLVDTARHFLDIKTLKRQIDALAASKMNVFHWHAVDAESFPVELSSEPLLSQGAYAPSARYSKAQMQDIISYAKARGVRTVIEIDVPGHAASWATGMPDLTVKCPAYSKNINNIPLNPTLDKTWQVVTNVFNELTSLFPDQYIHTGGDEVVTGCFTNDPSVLSWMNSHGMSSGTQLWNYFEQKLSGIVKATSKKHLVWEDVFNAGISMDAKETLIEVWSDHETLAAITAKGIKVRTLFTIFSHLRTINFDTTLGMKTRVFGFHQILRTTF